MNGAHRVVVTGVGIVSPVGTGAEAYWTSLKAGQSGIALPSAALSALNPKQPVGEVRDFDPLRWFGERELSALDRVAQFAVVAAREAVAQSGLLLDGVQSERTAAIVGTGVGGAVTMDDSYRRVYFEKAARVHPLTIPRLMPNAAASQVSMHLGIRGPSFGIVSACSSATHAIGLAFQMVRAGIADAAVAGGTEACLTFGTMRGWEALRVMASDTCRPFSRERKGLIVGEGAGIVVLETAEKARERGAEILGEVIGFGMTADAADLTNPDVGGMTRAIRGCLEDAAITPDDVDYVNAHGTGTLANDQTETAALKAAFGPRAAKVPTSSTKSMVGHALGAAGALEFVAALMAIRDGVAPPTVSYLGPDPACDLDYVPNVAREMPIRTALSNSFAFGGLNAVLAARRFS
ncbi:MAG TPA: beta-ketoacyl-[acyl-carrier-protein] synthase family protein [Bauldia sp.]|nr:beta-ketoacyl-[acyl-carrier-protein] synthase family protein [Bauldia sp.]